MSWLTRLHSAPAKPTRAWVRTNACRGYYVQLETASGDLELLASRGGRARHFRSLEQVRTRLRRIGVRQAWLLQQHACEEVAGLGAPPEPTGIRLI